MAQTAYRVPRRFIGPPEEPPPYGFFALSFIGHALFIVMAAALSAFVNAQADQSKIYVVNLVPAAPPLGSPAPRVVERPRVPERAPPKPEKAEAPRPQPKETPPPKPEKAELPAPKETPPPKPESVAPPRAPEVAKVTPPPPSELALPRKAEKETPALDTRLPRERLLERPPVPPPPATPPAEPPRVAPPQAPVAPPPTAAVARPVEPIRLGRPDSTAPATGSISLDVSDFPFTYYLRQIQAKISERWTPPRTAAIGGERAVVLFEIGRDGQIKEPAVERSSGNALYDQSALRAIMEASPFPPLPPEFRAPSLKVHFGFEFRPDQG
ncbi:MAG TPA: TonB family protein [Methylomirabilota bacterium]|jgi:TonB family protein|nr:TonB family protein [Methylomirabilota bacterium]